MKPSLNLLQHSIPACAGRFLVLYSIFLSSCTPPSRQIEPAFYHWKSTFKLSLLEKNSLEKLGAKTIYTRFFDVDLEGGKAIPVSILEEDIQGINLSAYNIVPSIFITNRTLHTLEGKAIYNLAAKIVKKLSYMYGQVKTGLPNEIQIDCDWSQSTKGKYFVLLEQIQALLPQKTKCSATIRLHQIKYFEKTGVPPVDRGVLMFYNMSNVRDTATNNSILDLAEAKKYLYNFDVYPLDLDLALPIFGWGVASRNGEMLDLISPLYLEDLEKDSHFVQVDTRHFELQESTYFKGKYLYAGDRIRLEQAEIPDLKISVQLLKKEIRNPDLKLIFYHLDSVSIQKYPYELLEKLLHDMH